MEAVVPETPRQGAYFPVYGHSDQEGGGDLHVQVQSCTTCHATVDEAHMADHEGWHETLAAGEGPGGPSGPKK
jgi:hypothetical protein